MRQKVLVTVGGGSDGLVDRRTRKTKTIKPETKMAEFCSKRANEGDAKQKRHRWLVIVFQRIVTLWLVQQAGVILFREIIFSQLFCTTYTQLLSYEVKPM